MSHKKQSTLESVSIDKEVNGEPAGRESEMETVLFTQKKYNKDQGYQTKGPKQLFLGSFTGNALRRRRCHLTGSSFFS